MLIKMIKYLMRHVVVVGFLLKSMANMISEAGGMKTDKAKEIKSQQLFGIRI